MMSLQSSPAALHSRRASVTASPPHPAARGYPTTTPPLERAIAIIRRNFVLLMVCILQVPAVALVYSIAQTPEYTASATLLFRDPQLDEKLFDTGVLSTEDPDRAAATNLRLVALDLVAERTARALPEADLTSEQVSEKVSVKPEGASNLVAIEATDHNPAFAARLASEFGNQYIAFRQEADRDKIQAALDLIDRKVTELTQEQRLPKQQDELLRRANELEVLASLQTGNAELVQPAKPPTSASSPKTKRNVALGLLLGLLLGASITALRELTNRRLTDPKDVDELFGMPTIGTVPSSTRLRRKQREPVFASGVEAESFRMLRSTLRYFDLQRAPGRRSTLITSAAPQDGKTTIAWNLALAEARGGARTLFLEADLRRPTLRAELNLPDSSGLSNVLAFDSDPADSIQHLSDMDVMLAGPLPPNPAELMESEQMRRLLQWADAEYDQVIIDTAPTAIVADAVPLFDQVAGLIVVIRLGRTPRNAAERLREQIERTQAPALGVVINGASARATRHYGGYYTSPPVAHPSQPGRREVPARVQAADELRAGTTGRRPRPGS